MAVVPVDRAARKRRRSKAARLRRTGALTTAAALAGLGLAGCGSSSGSGATPVINWYINPDSSGASDQIAAKCNAQANGAYHITISVLPASADGQREQIVRRLAAGDSSMDVISVDPPYTIELANAGWLYKFTGADRSALLTPTLDAPRQSAIWKGGMYAVPYQANTQLLWYRKSVVAKAGLDMSKPVTWAQIIDAAVKTGTEIGEQGSRYEGYMVWVNALVSSAGGSILTHNTRGQDATVTVGGSAGEKAAQILREFAHSKAASPSLSTDQEEQARSLYQSAKGGFMLNWPYAYAAAQADVKGGSAPKSLLSDIGWARYPRVDASTPSRPPLGGINLAVGAFSTHTTQDLQVVKCITSPAMERFDMLVSGNPTARGALYDDAKIRKAFPMADLMRQSINDAGPRPITPYYGDVSGAIQRTWSSPGDVNSGTPKKSATLISDVFHNKRLL